MKLVYCFNMNLLEHVQLRCARTHPLFICRIREANHVCSVLKWHRQSLYIFNSFIGLRNLSVASLIFFVDILNLKKWSGPSRYELSIFWPISDPTLATPQLFEIPHPQILPSTIVYIFGIRQSKYINGNNNKTGIFEKNIDLKSVNCSSLNKQFRSYSVHFSKKSNAFLFVAVWTASTSLHALLQHSLLGAIPIVYFVPTENLHREANTPHLWFCISSLSYVASEQLW